MPNVNIKYKLSVDATVTVNKLKFGTKDADLSKVNSNVYESTVRSVSVSDKVFIDLLMSGAAGKWELEVRAIKLRADGTEKDEGSKLVTFPIKGNIKKRNSLNAQYKINW